MPTVIPALIPTDVASVCAAAERLQFAPRLQIDIVDGVFATPASWPYTPAGNPAELGFIFDRFEVQVDIMALNPIAVIESWWHAGARAFVVHLESVASLEEILALRGKYQFELWVSGNDDLPIKKYTQYEDEIDGVQLMGISTIGSQGQPLSPRVLDNITALRAAAPRLPILIDGSVNEKTISQLAQAGATQFVVGSALAQAADPRAMYHHLCTLAAL